MDSTKDSITQLLEMLDDPQAYPEQEIRDMINHDEDTRETYRLMVEAKRGYRGERASEPDVEAAWRRFERERLDAPLPSPRSSLRARLFALRALLSPRYKVAASFVGLFMMSGIALAAILFARQGAPFSTVSPSPTEETTVSQPSSPGPSTPLEESERGESEERAVTFDNVTLDKLLDEMAGYYHTEVVFENGEARHLRFYFVWYKEQPLEKVVEMLNHFERVDIAIDDRKLIVR